ncbi:MULTISPECIES: alpha/beta hydrolase [unclassified Clostridium]|uniref:alpha/beta fold hydrolase n=1 Tax=unclassified Clostridium TaxID=2614128 RepID=UPI000297B3AE|nr:MULTISPECIES: alpha/beta hydrolase [unclassified Clostridium]EKQ54386.1 MAG: putative hydrolase or acyltransferase of alpha/beta superfamily [Clostridium sp. Maddingley MBC34-26]
MTTYHSIEVENLSVFYRKAGDPNKPVILLLHGFPSASHMFRKLIPILENEYHVIAPDYPGFGNTSSPDRSEFTYTFDNITKVIEAFVELLGLTKYSLYVFDYGAPIGFRLAMHHPERVTAIISQNGNVYHEGLGEKWAAREEYWHNPTKEKRESYRVAFAQDTIIHQYIDGTQSNKVSPDGYTLDIAYMSRPENDEKQLDLIFDYQNNVKMYPQFQQYLREYQPPLLAVWGKNDVSFIPEGAKAFKKDLPNAEIHLLNTGHFALETHAGEIGELILNFLKGIH